MKYVFGLDGGGTSSRLRIADLSNRAVIQETGEGINPNAVDAEFVGDRLEALFLKAAKGVADLASSDFASGCVAVAGMDRTEEKSEFEAILRKRLGFTCPLVLVSDPDAALVGGLGTLAGMILIAGTGSIAVARLSDGTRFRSGGFGHYLGDEGSAFFIGFQAIRRCLRSLEERDLATGMTEELISHFGLNAPEDFVSFTYRRFDKARIAGASPLVARYREQGDPLANDIYSEAVGELVTLVQSVYRRAGRRLTNTELLLWGGVFEHDRWMKDRVEGELRARTPELRVQEARNDAAYGACMLAIERARS